MTDIVRNLAERICSEYGLGKKNAQTKAMELYQSAHINCGRTSSNGQQAYHLRTSMLVNILFP